jgi:hypothetical protein
MERFMEAAKAQNWAGEPQGKKTIFVCNSTVLVGFGRFFQFISPYAVGRAPLVGDQPVAWPLLT